MDDFKIQKVWGAVMNEREEFLAAVEALDVQKTDDIEILIEAASLKGASKSDVLMWAEKKNFLVQRVMTSATLYTAVVVVPAHQAKVVLNRLNKARFRGAPVTARLLDPRNTAGLKYAGQF